MTRLAPVLLLAVLTACGGGAAASATPSGHTLTGTMTLTDAGAFALDLPQPGPTAQVFNGPSPTPTPTPDCQGSGGYSDLQAGAQVIVRDASEKTIAKGTLKPGLPLDADTCRFGFSVSGIPDSDFYSVEVSHRGALTYSAKDLDATGWALDLTIGE